jgi:hypothetical protein
VSPAPFSIASWHPIFSRHTCPAAFVPFPPEFRAYLESDGTQPPADVEDTAAEAEWSDDEGQPDEGQPDDSGPDDSGPDDDANSSSSSSPAAAFSFPELTAKLAAAIKKYGSVTPKLNFSAPRDATWLNANSLRCTCPADAYTLLKASDFVQHDLQVLAAHPSIEPKLCLRKWLDVPPGLEFRVFVQGNVVLAISQRDTATFYPYLAAGAALDGYVDQILDFVADVIVKEPAFGPESFAADVCVPPNPPPPLFLPADSSRAGTFTPPRP